jgi:hypothetical protein
VIGPEGIHDGSTTITEPVGRRTAHYRVERVRARTAPPPARPVEVDASVGCCMLFKRELYDEAGGFDEGYAPVWFEDVDMSLTARRLGTKVFLLGDVRVLHLGHLAGENPSLARRIGRRLPQRVIDVLVQVGQPKHPSADVRRRLGEHYAHWRQKWGFDLLNPDMDAIFAGYGGTEVCWRYDDDMRAAGERIAAADGAAQPTIS